ncbi:MAG: primosomal protein N' [Elusimicrobiaceae bacterium]|nr:primosomal protein N' [Elusimicrobiaceae bacterium]
MIVRVAFPMALNKEFDYIVPPSLEPEIQIGVRVKVPFGRITKEGFVIDTFQKNKTKFKLREIEKVLDSKLMFNEDILTLAHYIQNTWGMSIGEILAVLIPNYISEKYLDKLEKPQTPKTPSDFELSAGERKIFNSIKNFSASKPIFLKSLNYNLINDVVLALAVDAVKNKSQALILVPDIILSETLIKQAQQTFGDNVVLWHSKTLQSARKKIFGSLLNGDSKIIIGTRSACMLPFKNLKFTAFLDEHDDRYKQEENKPYYHAKDIILFRAKHHKTKILFSSMTPSVESFNMQKQGELEMVKDEEQLKHKPQIIVSEDKAEKGKMLSSLAVQLIEENLNAKKQTLLIMNRKGISGYFCLNCLTFVGKRDITGYKCPKCRNQIFKDSGTGTEKLQEEIKELFPKAKLLKVDSDCLKTKAGTKKLFEDLEKNKANIIITTNAPIKAMSFKNIGLASVVDIDWQMESSNFRSSEKAAQLLFGLYYNLALNDNKGVLFIPTQRASEYLFKSLDAKNYDDFLNTELDIRKDFVYPPFCHLIKIEMESKTAKMMQKFSQDITELLEQKYEDIEILGSVPTSRRFEKFLREYILIKLPSRVDIPEIIGFIAGLKNKTVNTKVVNNPYSFW